MLPGCPLIDRRGTGLRRRRESNPYPTKRTGDGEPNGAVRPDEHKYQELDLVNGALGDDRHESPQRPRRNPKHKQEPTHSHSPLVVRQAYPSHRVGSRPLLLPPPGDRRRRSRVLSTAGTLASSPGSSVGSNEGSPIFCPEGCTAQVSTVGFLRANAYFCTSVHRPFHSFSTTGDA